MKGASRRRNITAVTTSSVVPVRPSRVWLRMACRSPSLSRPQPRVPAPWRVSTKPSMTSLTRTSGAASRAQLSVSSDTARFAAA